MMMKKKKEYCAPLMDVVRLKAGGCLLAGSLTGEQYEGGGDPFSAPELFNVEGMLGVPTGFPQGFPPSND